MKVIGVQTDIVWEDREANFADIDQLIAAEADSLAGSLLVFPELSTAGFSMNPAVVAEPQDGASFQYFSGLAQRLQANILAGIARQDPESASAANEAVCFDKGGAEVARYRKQYPFPLVNEGAHYSAGHETVVYDLDGWKVAPLICYDLRFPEAFRRATAKGAELFIVIASWPGVRIDHWTTLLRARAIENLAYVIGVNRCGTDPDNVYPGASIIVGPKGEVLSEAGDSPCLLSADLDREELLQWRRNFPALASLTSTT